MQFDFSPLERFCSLCTEVNASKQMNHFYVIDQFSMLKAPWLYPLLDEGKGRPTFHLA